MSEIKLTADAGEKPEQAEKKPAAIIPPRALGVPVPMPVLGHGWVPTVWGRR